MSTSSLRRKAVIAALATAGGLAVPLVAAAPANAAEPTGISVEAPSDANVAQGDSHDFTIDLAGTGTTGTDSSVYYAVGSSLAGTPCSAVSASQYTCTVTATNPGVQNLTFFYDKAGTGTLQNGDLTTTGSLTAGGAVDSIKIQPTGAHVAQGQPQEYTVSAKDSAGRPVVDASLTVTGSQAGAADGALTITATKPAPSGTAGATTGNTAMASLAVTTGDGSGTNPAPAGSADVYVASTVSGTVNIALNTSPAQSTITDAATLTVDPGTLNDVTTVKPNPATITAYNNKTVTIKALLTNSQGDPVAGVTPTATIAGPNAGATTTATASDADGIATITYQAGATAGTDTVTVFVNKTTAPPSGGSRTGGLDSDEAHGAATVTIEAEDISTVGGQSVTVPAGELSASTTFKVTNAAGTAGTAGVGLTYSLSTADAKNYSLSSSTGTTDSSGNATVTVTALNAAAAADGKSVTVTATVTQDTTKTATSTISWQARAAYNVVITPFASTNQVGSTTSYSVSATDQFGSPVTNATYRWSVFGRNNASNNTGATGTGTTFSYTDKGAALTASQVGYDEVTVIASVGGVNQGSDAVEQYWVPSSAKATQVNGDLPPYDGKYVRNGGDTGPLVPSGFTKNYNTGTSSDPTADGSADVIPVEVALTDANGNPLYGDQVTFSSSGVGGFTDSDGHPLADSNNTTARVCDDGFAAGETEDACYESDVATVFVRSANPGLQTITITADGIQDQVTVNYSGQYVPVNPTRVADTRTGQGAISTGGGADAPTTLVPNTTYYFDYQAADTPDPENAEAYAFNVTAINPTTQGNLRVADRCNDGSDNPNPAAPTTSLINYQPGKTVANFIVLPNNCGGLRLYSDNSPVAVAIDLVGYYPTDDGIASVATTRIVDTRTGVGGATGKVAAGSSRSFQVAGLNGVPVGAKAVALNVTAISPGGAGNLRVYPDGASVPTTSNINYIKGVTKAAFVIVNLPADGKIDVYSDGTPVDVAIDLFAYYPSTSTLVTQAPSRILDTRTTTELASGATRNVQVTGRAGVPSDAEAVLVSITSIHAADSTGNGNLRVYPAGSSVPLVSTLNYVSKTSDVANFAIVKLGTNGQITLYSDGSPINVAVDVLGYVPNGGSSGVIVDAKGKHKRTTK